MNKKISLFSLIILFVLISGCAKKTEDTTPTAVSPNPININQSDTLKMINASVIPAPAGQNANSGDNSGQQQLSDEFCQKAGSNQGMSYAEARQIAGSSSCVSAGMLAENHFCNQNSGTWWIDLSIIKPGCAPACVVDVTAKSAEINWRCTGVVEE